MSLASTAVAPPSTPNFDAIKTKQQTVWGMGDYGRIGSTLQLSGEQLCEAMDLRAGQSVLDVAGGNGNATLAAARRFCNVVSTDYVEALLKQSAVRADADGLPVQYRVADAEDLPFGSGEFDNVMSTFGVMFTPNQEQAASELFRVCRRGGKIGLANWTPDGFIGQLFKVIGSHVAPPAGVQSPARWGTQEFLNEQFSDAEDVSVNERDFMFRYLSPGHFFDLFKTYYGPTMAALNALDDVGKKALEDDILALIEKFNVAADDTMVVPSGYLEVVITK